MHIYNIKINKNFIFKILLIFITLLTLGILFFSVFNIYHQVRNLDTNIADADPNIINIDPSNYTNMLKAISENPDDYVGKQISFSGYVYRLPDFNENEFVLARDMIISSDYQAVVVGFLCNYANAQDLKDGEWVQIVGTIEKGEYHGTIPIVNVTSLTRISSPSDEYVYPPTGSILPTA